MIANIDNPVRNSFSGIIDYHESKIEKGVAYELDSQYSGMSASNKKSFFISSVELNDKAKIKGFDIPFSFHPDEKITDDKFLEIWDDYSKDMGFNERPFVIYRHDDKEHQHYHVLVTNSNFKGEVNKNLQGFYKKDNVSVCRELELKHNLLFTHVTDKSKEKESTMDKYSFQNSISKAVNIEKHKNHLSKSIQLDKLNQILNEKNIDNKQINYLLGDNANNIKTYLVENSIYKESYKKQLSKILSAELKETKGVEDYIKGLEEKNIYARVLGKEHKHIKYGIKSEDGTLVYFSQKQLNDKFKLKSVINRDIESVFDKSKQLSYIKRSVNTCKYKVNNYVEFKDMLLKDYNINTIEASNTKGVYGVSFESNNVKNSIIFKASELDNKASVSYTKLQAYFNRDKAVDNRFLNNTVIYHLNNSKSYRELESNLLKDGFVLSKKENGYSVDVSSMGIKNVDLSDFSSNRVTTKIDNLPKTSLSLSAPKVDSKSLDSLIDNTDDFIPTTRKKKKKNRYGQDYNDEQNQSQ